MTSKPLDAASSPAPEALTAALAKARQTCGAPKAPWHLSPRSRSFAGIMRKAFEGGLNDEELIAIWEDAINRSPRGAALLRAPLLSATPSAPAWCALGMAAACRYERFALWALERGADPNARLLDEDRQKSATVFETALLKSLGALSLALAKSPEFDPRALDKWGRPCAHVIAYYSAQDKQEVHLALLEELLAKGADLHFLDSDGETALHSAALYEDVELCQELIRRGADPHAVSHRNLSVWDMFEDPSARDQLAGWAEAFRESQELSGSLPAAEPARRAPVKSGL